MSAESVWRHWGWGVLEKSFPFSKPVRAASSFFHSAIRPFPKASVRIEFCARSFSRTQPSGCDDFKVEMHEKAVNGARRKEDRGVQGGWRGGDKEMARKRAGGKAASYHEHETTLNHKTSHRP